MPSSTACGSTGSMSLLTLRSLTHMRHPGGQLGWLDVGVKHEGSASTGPSNWQQICPTSQQDFPQQVAAPSQEVPAEHGGASHVPLPQKEVGATHGCPQPPQFFGSLKGSTSHATPSQQIMPSQLHKGQFPPPPELEPLLAPLLDPLPEPLPELPFELPPELLPPEPDSLAASTEASPPM